MLSIGARFLVEPGRLQGRAKTGHMSSRGMRASMDIIVVEDAVGVGEGRGARGVMRRVTELTSGKVPLEKTLQ